MKEEEKKEEEAPKPKPKKKLAGDHDMNDDNYDYVVLGTNLSENILAAGLAIQGQKCLLLD